jgi:hypothetical protein
MGANQKESDNKWVLKKEAAHISQISATLSTPTQQDSRAE